MKDHCSFSPDFNFGDTCCKQHDIDYAFQEGKFKSDWKFFKCVKNKCNLIIAAIYYSVVSTLGWYWYVKANRKRS